MLRRGAARGCRVGPELLVRREVEAHELIHRDEGVADGREVQVVEEPVLRSEVNNSLIIVNFFHKIQNFRQISDLISQI